MIVGCCGGLALDDVTLTVVNDIITPIEQKNPTGYIIPNCGSVKFSKDAFQVINGVLTVREAQDAEIEPLLVPQAGCGGLLVDGKYFQFDKNFGLSIDWDLVPDQD